MNNHDDVCPFKIGDDIVYRPSQRGYDLTVMFTNRLIPGALYKVKDIPKGLYVVVEGYDDPSGGLYWTEFEKV